MVSNWLDYCNSLLYRTSKGSVAKLHESWQPFIEKLHWLSISYYILFKYNLLIFKARNLSQSPYLKSLIKFSSLTSGNRLSVSSVHPRKAIGRHGFVTAASVEWNKLPFSVKSKHTISSYRSHVKTNLFRLAYPLP